MRIITITLTLFLTLLLFTENKAQAFVYTIDIKLPLSVIIDPAEKIGGLEFTVKPSNSDLVHSNADLGYELGDAIPAPPPGHWIFETYTGDYCAVYDDYQDYSGLSDIAPMLPGRIITITSAIELDFDALVFYDFSGKLVPGDYFSSEGFQLAPVPIPGALFLLGSGLIGLIAVRRKQMNK